MSNPWREDIETWEEILLGTEHTIEGLFNELNHPYHSAMALYPVTLHKQNMLGPEMDVPIYDHHDEEVRFPEKNITRMMDSLDGLAVKEDDSHLNKPSSKGGGDDYRASQVTAMQYSDYTIDVLEA